jgi:DNA-binding PadR family transcriptional regulator
MYRDQHHHDDHHLGRSRHGRAHFAALFGPPSGDEPPAHRGPGGHGGRGGHRGHGRPGGGRARRGDIRTATLLLLAESPMHGYQLMQAMTERTGGAWRPSPGAIYPTIAQLEDEGLVTILAEGGRKLVTLTEAGRRHLAEHRAGIADPFTAMTADPTDGPDLRGPLDEVAGAARTVARSGTASQVAAAARVLSEARRALYLILAGDPGEQPGDGPTAGR